MAISQYQMVKMTETVTMKFPAVSPPPELQQEWLGSNGETKWEPVPCERIEEEIPQD